MRNLSTLHRRSTLASVLVAAPLSLVLLGGTALAAPGPGNDKDNGRASSPASSSAADTSRGADRSEAPAKADKRDDAPAPARAAAPARSDAQEGTRVEAPAKADKRDDTPAPARAEKREEAPAPAAKRDDSPAPAAAAKRDDSPAPASAGSKAGKRDDTPAPAAAGSKGGGRPSGDVTKPQPLSNADKKGGGANPGTAAGCGAYCSTRDGSASQNGNGGGKATGKPCAGCVGKADNKNPQGQRPNGNDRNNGYECDGNRGIGKGNPAHTGCAAGSVPPKTTPNPGTPGKPDNSCKGHNGNGNGKGNGKGGKNCPSTPGQPGTPGTPGKDTCSNGKGKGDGNGHANANGKGNCPTTPGTVSTPTTPGRTATQLPAVVTGGGAISTPGTVLVPVNGSAPSLGPVVPGSAPVACPSGPAVNGMVAGCPVATVTDADPLASPATGVVLRPRAAGNGALVETVSYDASGALPRTGGDTGALLGLSALLVLGGGTLVAAGRRRTSKA